MIFRTYTHRDFERCLEIFESNTPPYFDESERREFVAFLADPVPYFVIESEDGLVVACGGLKFSDDPRRAHLCWGMVDRMMHRAGLGRMLLQRRLEWVRKHEPLVAEVWTQTSPHTAAFFEKHGFSIVREEPDFWAPGLHLVEMRKTA